MTYLDIKIFPSERTGYSLPPGIYERGDINKTLSYLLTNFVKESITIDDIRLSNNLNFNQTLLFTEKSFFTILVFIQPHSRTVCDNVGYIQLIPGTHKSEKHNKNNGIDKIHLECDCVFGSIVNGIREPIL